MILLIWRCDGYTYHVSNQFIEPQVANSVGRAHVFGNHVRDGIRYSFMPWELGGYVVAL